MSWRERAARWLRRAREVIVAHRRSLAIGLVLFVGAAILFRWLRAGAGYWAIDDAGITYAAALELADHGSLAPNLEATPVEGYSNPLLFFIAALLRLVRAFDPITTHVRLETIVFSSMIVLVWRIARRLTGELAGLAAALAFALIELMIPASSIWYGSGLENVWVSAGLVALLWICVRTSAGVPLSPAWGVLAFAVSITRPEAPVYVAGFYACLFAFARGDVAWSAHARRIARALAVTAALYVAFLVWRRLAYQLWWPNTYYAKLAGELHFTQNIREYVMAELLPYQLTAVFGSCVLALLFVRKLETAAQCLVIFLLAALALPITAGPDWMGHHRFGTPFFAICHLCYALLLATCIAALSQRRLAQIMTAAIVIALPFLLRTMKPEDTRLSKLSVAGVAQVNGLLRWEHQMRLGVPYPVVITPDAGGTLLVNSLQLLDNGYLNDFQMSRLGRGDEPIAHRTVNQYQHEERRPDLLDDNRFYSLPRQLLGTRYLLGPATFYARNELVELDAVPADAQLLLEHASVRVFLSPTTVRTAAPGALIRCELFIEWSETAALDQLHLRAEVAAHDHDDLPLTPYKPRPTGVERRAVLVGAPPHAGPIAISLELLSGNAPVARGFVVVDVTNNPAAIEHAAAAILAGPNPALRLAWLREQLVRRLPMHTFRDLSAALFGAAAGHEAIAGKYIMLARWNARLAALEPQPTSIRTAEATLLKNLFAACKPETRIFCLGRTVDDLRRLGYLGSVETIAPELRRASLSHMALADRYRALVGLTLAMPENHDWQWQLLRARHELAVQDALPTL